ncbi:tetratricopeptide repeat protein [Methylomonas albis]|uniref:Tetratricopeptide repeat protein n=1 Tax=Methylomonas albis TaxID=1854563 RepID=A0ABR9D410_9GAMM|nr:tetratricopeptide repeat protein [Methylomonas albis]MBD9357655.1 tetratricopeptide repeat protein [Methylomonas albis]
MHSLIAFATQWGSKFGGINAFNTDFLSHFGVAYPTQLQVICIVSSATETEIADAKNDNVTLVTLPYPPSDKLFTVQQANAAIDELAKQGIPLTPEFTIWLGHDRISGRAALQAAKQFGGRSALIHHMSYAAYEAYAEDSHSAHSKKTDQEELFKQADLRLAVGPGLHEALCDLIDVKSEQIHLIIPGLANIDPRNNTPQKFSAFISGRLSDDAARIKQAQLGIAAFANAIKQAQNNQAPEKLINQPKLTLRGVDFESRLDYNQSQSTNPEQELLQFAESYADQVITLHALPYTQDRTELYNDLKSASAAMMPSWHEGFGLVAWEAIAACVPLIVSMQSGVYQLLKQQGLEGFVYPIQVRGKTESPFFHDDDLAKVAKALIHIATNVDAAKQKAHKLKTDLAAHTWSACVEEVAKECFKWHIEKGSPKLETATAQLPQLTNPQQPLDDSPLTLPVKQWRADLGYAESQMLRADFALVPFDPGRQTELNTLNAWLDNQDGNDYLIKTRLLTGAGGLGKTRLAIELCQQRMNSGWHCGFLNREDSAQSWAKLQTAQKPLLIVIDYAETRQETLLNLLKARLKADYPHPVRLLLLARGGGEWWDQLPGKDAECEALLNGYATSGPYVLPELYLDQNSRQQAYQNALAAYATATDRQIPAGIPDLGGEHFAKPLYLQMAALLALYGERPTTAIGLTQSLLNHERRYWLETLKALDLVNPQQHAQDLLALTTLSNGFKTPKQAYEYYAKAKPGLITQSVFSPLFKQLEPLYPGTQGLQGIQPDIFGEALVAQSLQPTTGLDLLDVILSSSADKAVQHHALTVLARLSLHAPELDSVLIKAIQNNFVACCLELVDVAVQTQSRLPNLAQQAFQQLTPQQKSQTAGLLENRFEYESICLAELAYEVTFFKTKKSAQKLKKNRRDIQLLSKHATDLLNLTVDALRLGKDDEAVNFAQQALQIFKQLCHQHRVQFEPDYAWSLDTYALPLSNLGRNDEAADYTKLALEIYERLAQQKPDQFEPDYAKSLHNYAHHLGKLGRNEEAADYTQRALAIRERLAQQRPDRFEPDYAMSLSNYASHLINLGRDDEATNYPQQALAIYERLAQQRPDRFEPDYAVSLNNYASHLSYLGRNNEAADYAQQALAIRERLAQQRPDRFEPDYATSLSNYASHLSDLGRNDEAAGHAQQALAIRERWAQQRPDRFEPDYALSLNIYANRLSDLGRNDEAADYAQQALAIYERLALKTPQRFNNNHFTVQCYWLFAEWLSLSPASVSLEFGHIAELPDFIATHKQPACLFYARFVQGCLSQNAAQQFQQAIALWSQLTKTDQQNNRAEFLCVCAWLAQYDADALPEQNWLDVWQQFTRQRQGRLPKWLETVAARLDFSWPQSTSLD